MYGFYRSVLKCYVSYYLVKTLFQCRIPIAVFLSHRSTPLGGALLHFAFLYNVYCCSWGFNPQSYRFCLKPGSQPFKHYEYAPTISEKEYLLNQLSYDDIDLLHSGLCQKLRSGQIYKDACIAYTESQPTSNIFKVSNPTYVVFLHAFTDFPNTHFGRQNFLDYRDWLDATIEYILNDPRALQINWIIRQHPNNNQYPVDDFDPRDLTQLFKNHHNVSLQFGDNLESLPQLMDRIDLAISCGGSILAESVAIHNTPCLAAFNSHPYTPYSFCTSSCSVEQYLSHLHNPEVLSAPTKHQIYEAKFAMIYVYILSSWPLDNTYFPALEYDFSKIAAFSIL